MSRQPGSLRRLLPATTLPASFDSQTGPSSAILGSSSRRLPRANRHVQTACEPCRLRKSKCSGGRPTCSECLRRNTPCVYPTLPQESRTEALRRRHDTSERKVHLYEEFHRMMCDRPEHEVRDIVNRLRAGDNVETLVRSVQTGDMLLQLHDVPEEGHMVSALNEPVAISALDGSPNLYHASPLSLAHSDETLFDAGSAGGAPSDEAGEDIEMSGPGVAENEAVSDIEAKIPKIPEPVHSTLSAKTQLISARLDAAKPSEWTSVSSDDALMRRLLAEYCLYDYPFSPCFHMNLFLDDMAHGRIQFCSSLLLNSVLAVACHRLPDLFDRANFSNLQNLGYRFLAEARRQWDLTTNHTLCSIEAGAILFAVHNDNSTDKGG